MSLSRSRTRIGLALLLALIAWMACAPSTGGDRRGVALTEAKREGAALVAAGSYPEAIALLEPLSRAASGDPQLFIIMGDAYSGLERPSEAVAGYEQSIRLAYNNPEAHLKLATVLMSQGKTGRALTEFEVAVRQGPRLPLVHYNYGLALHELGRGRDALDHWRKARTLDPGNPLYHEAMGIGLTPTDARGAARAFAQAEELGAAGASFQNNYGLALQGMGDHAGANARFNQAVNEAGGKETYRFNLAASTMRLGEWARAATMWEALLAQFGEHWSYRVYLGRASVEQGQFQDALDALRAITERVESGELDKRAPEMDRDPPGLDVALAVLALAHRGLGDKETALDTMRRAVALSPDNPSHLNNYGVILAENGMVDEARAQWRRVLELRPGDATATGNLSSSDP